MRKVFILAAVLSLALACVPAFAWFIFQDDFESGPEPGTNWLQGGVNMTWSDTISHSPTHALKEWTAAGSMYHIVPNTLVVGTYFQFWFYDPGAATNVRHFGRLASYADPGTLTGLQELLAIGSYNAGGVDTSKYSGRAAFSNPLGGTTQGWFTLNVSRSVGWHKMRIEIVGGEGSGVAGKGLADWYVDDVLGYDDAPIMWKPFNVLIMGANLTSTNPGDYYYDDVEFGIVPEPGSLLALGTGIVGLAGLALRRRR